MYKKLWVKIAAVVVFILAGSLGWTQSRCQLGFRSQSQFPVEYKTILTTPLLFNLFGSDEIQISLADYSEKFYLKIDKYRESLVYKRGVSSTYYFGSNLALISPYAISEKNRIKQTAVSKQLDISTRLIVKNMDIWSHSERDDFFIYLTEVFLESIDYSIKYAPGDPTHWSFNGNWVINFDRVLGRFGVSKKTLVELKRKRVLTAEQHRLVNDLLSFVLVIDNSHHAVKSPSDLALSIIKIQPEFGKASMDDRSFDDFLQTMLNLAAFETLNAEQMIRLFNFTTAVHEEIALGYIPFESSQKFERSLRLFETAATIRRSLLKHKEFWSLQRNIEQTLMVHQLVDYHFLEMASKMDLYKNLQQPPNATSKLLRSAELIKGYIWESFTQGPDYQLSLDPYSIQALSENMKASRKSMVLDRLEETHNLEKAKKVENNVLHFVYALEKIAGDKGETIYH